MANAMSAVVSARLPAKPADISPDPWLVVRSGATFIPDDVDKQTL